MERLNTVLAIVSVNGEVCYPFTHTESIRKESVNVLPLDTRSSNGLKRNSINTIGELLDNIDNGNLFKIRSMGKKSINRILYELCAYQYKRLTKEKQNDFLMQIIKLNTKAS